MLLLPSRCLKDRATLVCSPLQGHLQYLCDPWVLWACSAHVPLWNAAPLAEKQCWERASRPCIRPPFDTC